MWLLDKVPLSNVGQEIAAALIPMGLTFEACCTNGNSQVNDVTEGMLLSAVKGKTCVDITDRDATTD